MKKKSLTLLKLNKKSISNFQNDLLGGYNANTCESPCQGGTSCCSEGGQACEADEDKEPFRLPPTSFRTIVSRIIC